MNKEVEEAKEWLKDKREYYKARMKDYEKDDCLTSFYYEIKKDETIMETLLNYIEELEKENTNLKELDTEHQRINGELRERVKELEEEKE